MDKYTKFILTMIAVALFGINYHLFSGDIISSAKASHGGGVHKIAICNSSGAKCADIPTLEAYSRDWNVLATGTPR